MFKIVTEKKVMEFFSVGDIIVDHDLREYQITEIDMSMGEDDFELKYRTKDVTGPDHINYNPDTAGDVVEFNHDDDLIFNTVT